MKNRFSEKLHQFGIGSLTISLTLALCAAILFYLFLSHLNLVAGGLNLVIHIFSPVIGGIILAYVIDPLVTFFEMKPLKKIKKESLRRNISVVISLLIVAAVISILLMSLIPQLISSMGVFFNNLGTYVRSMRFMLGHITELAEARHLDLSQAEVELNKLLSRFVSSITASSGILIEKSISFGTDAVNIMIAVILAIYFSMDKKRMLQGAARFMKVILGDKQHEVAVDFLSRCNETLVTFIILDLVEGLIVGIINFVFMIITGIPYAALISIIVGMFNLAPTFGPVAGCLLGAFLLLLVNPWYALVFVIFTIVLQIFDGYIFKPRLFGNRFGVSAIWILIFIIVGGRLMGVTGILLAIPLASICDYIYHDIVMRKLEKRKARNDQANNDANAMAPEHPTDPSAEAE